MFDNQRLRATLLCNIALIILVALFEAFPLASAEICSSGQECDYHEYCCGDECCSNEGYGYGYGYGFYNLWYFWFVIIMIMMTCCGACSYVKKRQYYMRQQQAIESMATTQPTTCPTTHHYPPNTYGVHPNVGPPVGTFPAPPAYTEVTDKPDQYPKAEYGYPNYGFAAPPYAPLDPHTVPQSSTNPPTVNTTTTTIPSNTPTASANLPSYPGPATMSPGMSGAASAYPVTQVVDSNVAPPPYTPPAQDAPQNQSDPTPVSA